MSKIVYYNRQQNVPGAGLVAINRPTQPVDQKQPVAEKRIADPSSCSRAGLGYPIPNFFEYRARAKEFDSL